MNENGEQQSVFNLLGDVSLPTFDFNAPSGGGLPEINISGLSELTIDPTIKKTTAAAKTTKKGKAAAAEAPKGGFSLPFLKPYDDQKLSYAEMLNKKGRK
eukprot:CAMPEP_0167767072 /NCGR_PEP_ID=MMETSP0110_2-20121227/15798_1 /TAXON_ID=629695 /ORGANISM="Gymnochlora sp., Strain CCMP2014" /LENGTH=99 /DNA_ID=CAMNT_0007655373 /DNA_START=607 /DNA_END=906 /DNA_ORIENTATION=-